MPVKLAAPAPFALPSPLATTCKTPARRPSPWHEIATTLPAPCSRRGSTPAPPTPPAAPIAPLTPATPPTPAHDRDSDSDSVASLSPSVSSQALRDWERLLAAPDSDVTRHALVPLPLPLSPSEPAGSPPLSASVPKLAAERDKEGHIEYKLKLIEPSPERFERLVTQMMWRLKQGRNEAIYELGLADDGAVIGLTRAEMDASLATLERMASEVGATVLVLKEIVLASPSTRPDLDENGRPRKGTKALNGLGPEKLSRRERLRLRREAEAAEAAAAGEPLETPRRGRQIIFDIDADSESDEEEVEVFKLDEEPRAAAPSPTPSVQMRAEAKRRKSAARREARRLDLLRGDGTLPFTDKSSSPIAEMIGHAPGGISGNLGAGVRASSLRLAQPRSAASTEEEETRDDFDIPLDTLSLSFADVHSERTVTHALAPTLAPPGEELICVEALVVRKASWEEEGWGFGGEEDGWGFGEEE